MGFFSRGYRPAQFDNKGDGVEGTICAPPVVQQAKDEEGKLKTSRKGNPLWVMIIPLQTNMRTDDEDDGVRGWYLNKYSDIYNELGAILAEVGVDDEDGDKTVEMGAYVKVTWPGTTRPNRFNKGGTPAKVYQLVYKPASQNPLTLGSAAADPDPLAKPDDDPWGVQAAKAQAAAAGDDPWATSAPKPDTTAGPDLSAFQGLDNDTLQRLAALAAQQKK